MSDADVFISYASEDREVAERIARELIEAGIPAFIDRFELRVGDSIIDTIGRGLAAAKYGIVILSPYSLYKEWPRHEINQLFKRHIQGETKLLPVWHNVTANAVDEALPGMSDIWAVDTEIGLRGVVRELAGQIVEATVAVVPLYQRPLYRFLIGDGELTLGLESDMAFTLWEALLHFGGEMYPLYVEGEKLDRRHLLANAAEALARPGVSKRLGEETAARIAEMCRTEIGVDPASLGS